MGNAGPSKDVPCQPAQTLSSHPFWHGAPAVAPTSDAATSQKSGVKSQPQHSPASEPTITHARSMGNTTFAASAKERIHSLCSQTKFNLLPNPPSKNRQLHLVQGHRDMFSWATSLVSFPGHQEEISTYSGHGAGRRFHSG